MDATVPGVANIIPWLGPNCIILPISFPFNDFCQDIPDSLVVAMKESSVRRGREGRPVQTGRAVLAEHQRRPDRSGSLAAASSQLTILPVMDYSSSGTRRSMSVSRNNGALELTSVKVRPANSMKPPVDASRI